MLQQFPALDQWLAGHISAGQHQYVEDVEVNIGAAVLKQAEHRLPT